jgi:preprotein translocase subunit SecB
MPSQTEGGGTTPPAGASGGQAAGQAPPLVIGAQYIKDLSFENPLGPQGLTALQNAKVQIEVNTSARPLGSNLYEVSLTIHGQADAEGKPVFIVELTYAAVVTLNGVTEALVRPALLIEAPRHLFPFARAIVAGVTRDGGFPPLMINPLDFTALYVQQHGELPSMETA